MKKALLACLPVVVGGAVWLLVGELSSPAAVEENQRLVTTTVAHDSSGNGHDAIIQGPVELGRPGHDGSSYSFDRRGSWLMVPPSPDLNPGKHDFLVSAWIYLRTGPEPGETYDVVRKGISFTDPGEFKLEVLSRGRVRCTAKGDTGRTARVITTDIDVADGHWHRIGCARTGRRWSVLADDTVASQVVELGAVRNDVALSIGSKYGLEDRPDGRVDDVMFVLGAPYDEKSAGDLTRLEALEQGTPAARWLLDESPANLAAAP